MATSERQQPQGLATQDTNPNVPSSNPVNAPPPAYISPGSNFEYHGDMKEKEPPSYDEEKGKTVATPGFVTIGGRQYNKRKLRITGILLSISILFIIGVLIGAHCAQLRSDDHSHSHRHRPTPTPTPTPSEDPLSTTDTTTNSGVNSGIECLTPDCVPLPEATGSQEKYGSAWISANKE